MTLRWRSKMQENMLRGSVVAISCIANVSVALWLSFETEPVCLDDLPTDVMVSASWYGCKDESRCIYEFDAAIDRKLWSLEHYIGSPCLEYNANSRLFHLTNPTETLAALDAAVLQTAPAKPGAKRTRGEEAEILEKKRQQQSAQWDERPVGVSTGN